MALDALTEALKRIAGPEEYDAPVQADSLGEEIREYFCIEDTLLSKDIDVTVVGVGKLSFPLTEETIKNMMKVSSKAKFGRGVETVLDTSVRDTQTISSNNLKVEINNDTLSEALERMCSGLNLHKNATLVPHLYNMLIYGPGQFFKMHRDSEKMKNMVATLVILLPSDHKGGDLIIQHINKKHVFFGSKNPDIVKCVVFYSDCQHEIKEVTDGYRVALTYNVVLDMSKVTNDVPVEEGLSNAVLNYFNAYKTSNISTSTKPNKLVYFLNHSYSEHSLKWDLLKGSDRSCALALLSVAKHQGRLPCLALANQTETYDAYSDSGDSDLLESNTCLYFWVNENSLKFEEIGTEVSDRELCYTVETRDRFEPFKTEESGPTGNAGETKDHWYKRACVVLWMNRWVCSTGFKDAIFDLHGLTTSDCNQVIILNEIDNAGQYFYQKGMWKTTGVCDLLIDIVRYINNSEKAISILSKLPLELLKEDKLDCFLQLETQFGNETWMKILTGWKQHSDWNISLKIAVQFIEAYVKKQTDFSKSQVVGLMLKDCVDGFIKSTKSYGNQSVFPMRYSYNINKMMNSRYIYDKTTSREITNSLCTLLYICDVLKNSLLENTLIEHVISTPSVFPSQGLAETYFSLKEARPSECAKYKILADTALVILHQDLTEIKSHGDSWYWPIDIPCSCQFCKKVQSFFNCAVNKNVSIPAAAQNRAHVYSFLNPLKNQPVTFNTQRYGSPYKIKIEKNEKLLKDRKSLIKELIDVENKLLVCTTLMANNDSSNNLASTSGNQNSNQHTNDADESAIPTKRVKI